MAAKKKTKTTATKAAKAEPNVMPTTCTSPVMNARTGDMVPCGGSLTVTNAKGHANAHDNPAQVNLKCDDCNSLYVVGKDA